MHIFALRLYEERFRTIQNSIQNQDRFQTSNFLGFKDNDNLCKFGKILFYSCFILLSQFIILHEKHTNENNDIYGLVTLHSLQVGQDRALRGGLHEQPDGDGGGPGQEEGHTQALPTTGSPRSTDYRSKV